eukprot:202888-Prymnesium_polylepis.1
MRLLQNTQLLITDIRVTFEFPPAAEPAAKAAAAAAAKPGKGVPLFRKTTSFNEPKAPHGFRFSVAIGNLAVTGGAASDGALSRLYSHDSVSLSKKVQVSRLQVVWASLPDEHFARAAS